MVFSDYEEKVFRLALDLTGSEEAAFTVVDKVHTRLAKELCRNRQEPLDTLIHRFTYDAALPLLFERVQENCDELDACCTWITGEKHSMVC